MKKIILLSLLSLLTISTSAFARSSKCKVKTKIKILKSENKYYNYCLGNFSEDGDGYYYDYRSYKFYDLSRLECENTVTKDIIGQRVTVKTLSELNTGFLILGEPHYNECDGTIESIIKTKYTQSR